MTRYETSDLPLILCPNCGDEFEETGDYGALGAGDSLECPSCRAKLQVLSVETIVQIRVAVSEGGTP